MPGASVNAWYRMYSEFATDAKVQNMSETLQRRFTMFLCLQCSGEFERFTHDELATALRITTEELTLTKEVFTEKRFLDATGKIRSWNKRQFKSDNSSARVKKHRSKKRNGDGTAMERPQIQITDTDTDKNQSKNMAAAPPRVTPKVLRETLPPVDPEWVLDFKLAYPARAGDHRWRSAMKAARARLAEGYTTQQFVDGANRYRVFCQAAGSLGSQYVKSAATFLGTDKGFLEAWTPPATKSQAQQDKNISVAQQWLAKRGEVLDASR